MNNPDHISESLETIFWVKIVKFFNAEPGRKNSDPGCLSRIGNTAKNKDKFIQETFKQTNKTLRPTYRAIAGLAEPGGGGGVGLLVPG
jgi:hypothetical protein